MIEKYTEKYIEIDGPNKGRIIDKNIAEELAYTEDGWREEMGGVPMNQPDERVGKPEVRFREMVEAELVRLILKDITSKIKDELDGIYSTEAARQADPEQNDENWLRYRMANLLLQHGIDYQTCNAVLELPFAEAFEAAYGILAQAGLDADLILAEYK